MCFHESKWSNMRWRPGPRYRELTALPRPLTGQRGKWKENEGRRGWERETRGGWETGTGYRREERKGKEGEKERREVYPQLQLLHPPVFGAKQFHTVKAGGHRVQGCLSFACGELLGWVIPRTSNGVCVDGGP